MYQQGLLNGRRIFITGGGSGLGRAMGARFMELGASLVICGRRREVLEEAARTLAADHGGGVETYVCDIRDPEAVEQMVEDIFAHGPLHGLVNNAAGNIAARTETLSHRAMDAVINIVLHGTAYVTLACGKRWLAAGQKASVLSILATYAWTGSAYVVPSAMAKAGVLAMTRSLAVEWGGRGIRLNAIAPGPFPTQGAWERLVPSADLARRLETKNPFGRPGRHQELTDLATFLMANQSAYINGEVVTIDGGEWLQGAGEFNFLGDLPEAAWEGFRPHRSTETGTVKE